MRRQLKRFIAGVLLLGAGGLGIGAARAATIMVSADIPASETWTADNEYVLTQVIYVTSGATLTIEPGTVVRGEPTSGANDPGTLVITRGSKIIAVGNSRQPIVFTNLDDDNVGGNVPVDYDTPENVLGVTGAWGGVVLLGRGHVANNTGTGPNPSREVQIEGPTAAGSLGFHGNCAGGGLLPQDCDDDDSGSMSKEKISLAQLPFKLQSLKAAARDPKVMVSGAGGANFRTVVSVLDEARKIGIAKVGISTEKK